MIDIVLGIPILYGMIKGLQKGVIIEITGLLALLVGLYVSVKCSSFAANWLMENTEIQGKFIPALGYALTFVAVCFGVFALGKVLDKMVEVVMLGWLNKLLGAIFGGLKILVILSGLLLVVEGFDQDFHFFPDHLKQESLLYNPIKETAGMVVPAVKESPLFKEVMDLIDF